VSNFFLISIICLLFEGNSFNLTLTAQVNDLFFFLFLVGLSDLKQRSMPR
jgi:hypothetical protein